MAWPLGRFSGQLLERVVADKANWPLIESWTKDSSPAVRNARIPSRPITRLMLSPRACLHISSATRILPSPAEPFTFFFMAPKEVHLMALSKRR